MLSYAAVQYRQTTVQSLKYPLNIHALATLLWSMLQLFWTEVIFFSSCTHLAMWHMDTCLHPHDRTVGGQSVWLPTLGVSSVDSGLLHAAELWLTSVRRHGRGRRCGEDVGVGP